ncbi:NfeD family protein [Allorhodopirellula solitaria]|uniref:NfeD-like C-terminal domain-containing protein n=1 Tax=Allorhodopirellula solitaria TaxID=2527987 RepID=A0A5C5X091_9BACT|nr:NfeD family protein [Allorhodopirellula solitaria]TWT56407.1 hypothetical protein CA85_42200 [Allorhodopirellula solitaria]
MPAYYAVGLLIAFYALAIAEILIPSGGMLGLTAAVVGVTSIIIGYTYSASLALTLTLVYLITTPILIALLIRLWPSTKIGRRMLNRDTLEADSALPEPATNDGTPLSEFVGHVGTAMSNLYPSGEIKMAGHRTDAISTGLPIDAGTLVSVVRVYSGKLQVRIATEEEIQQWRAENAGLPSEPERPLSPPVGDPMSIEVQDSPVLSPLDDVDFDSLEIDAGSREDPS